MLKCQMIVESGLKSSFNKSCMQQAPTWYSDKDVYLVDDAGLEFHINQKVFKDSIELVKVSSFELHM